MATYTDIGSFDLERGFPYGSHEWKPPMDRNLLKIANVMNGSAKSRTAALPLDAAAGAVYIAPDGIYAGRILISSGPDAWQTVTPRNGLLFLIEDEGIIASYFDGAWVRAMTLGGAAPNDRLTITTFHAGPVPDDLFIFRRVTAGAIRLLGAGPHFAVAQTGPTAACTLNIAVNGSIIGSVAFEAAATVGVVTVPEYALAAGDVLTIASGAAYAVADLAITLSGRREFDVT